MKHDYSTGRFKYWNCMLRPCCTWRIFRFSFFCRKKNIWCFFAGALKSGGPLHTSISTSPPTQPASSGLLQASDKLRHRKQREVKKPEGDIDAMTSAMRGSRGRAVRSHSWARHILARLPLMTLEFLPAHTSNSYFARADTQEDSPDDAEAELSMVISS